MNQVQISKDPSGKKMVRVPEITNEIPAEKSSSKEYPLATMQPARRTRTCALKNSEASSLPQDIDSERDYISD